MSSYYNNNVDSQAQGQYTNSNYYGNQQQQQQPQAQPAQSHNNASAAPTPFHQGYGDPNSWQQQQYDQYNQQQQPSYPMQQQQQQQPSMMSNSFWDPAAAAKMAAFAVSMANNTSTSANNNDTMMFNLAGEAGKTILQSKSAQLLPSYYEYIMNTLRIYFAVDNQYVTMKMKRILFPFLSKHWKRQQKDAVPNSDHTATPSISYQLPIHDECAPDLYIPIMAGITYVLLAAYISGTVGKFNPKVISSITTQCLIVQVLEVSCIRLGFYMMQSHVAILDLFSYTGYKYLGLCINMILAILFGRHGFGLYINGGGIISGYYISYIWTASSLSYFMLKTMANNIPLHTSPHGPKREVMVLVFAVSQFITMWLVSQTKFI